MKGDVIPDGHHVARFCSAGQMSEGGKVSGVAFRLRRNVPADDYFSVNWLEHLHPDNRQAQIVALREAVRRQGVTIRANSTGRFAVLNVDRSTRAVKEKSEDHRELRFLHEPLEVSPSHSAIFGYGLEDDLIADLIAETVTETHPAGTPQQQTLAP